MVALQTWLKLARIGHGPLFRRVTGQGKAVDAERLNDQEVARLVKRVPTFLLELGTDLGRIPPAIRRLIGQL